MSADLKTILECDAMERDGKTIDCVDGVIGLFHGMLGKGEYQRCNALLEAMTPASLTTQVTVGALMCTYPFGHQLPARSPLFNAAKEYFTEVIPDRVENLLKGMGDLPQTGDVMLMPHNDGYVVAEVVEGPQ